MSEPALRATAPHPFAMQWRPAGPVAAAYEASVGFNPRIIGPYGSGKTTASCRKAIALANRLPGQRDTFKGRPILVKSCRVAMFASTHRILWTNFLPSYWKVFPKEWGVWTGGKGEPAEHKIKLWAGGGAPSQANDGHAVLLELQHDMIGVADRSMDDITHGLELTGGYGYEWDTLPQDFFTKVGGRLGRWPNMATGEEQDLLPRQIWGDCNAFDPDHWGYDECFDNRPPGVEVFVQPSALSPKAENIQNVGRKYYEHQLSILKPWQIARVIENRFVPDRPGFVIYTDWNPLLHEAGCELAPEPTLPLLIGLDQGPKAAAVIAQRSRPHVWRAIDELAVPKDEGWTAKRMALTLADKLAQDYPRFPVLAIADPAAKQNAGVEGDTGAALNWLAEFQENFPYPVTIALSNRVKGSSGVQSAVRDVLTTIDAGAPALQVSSRCKVLRKGFNGAYRWKPKPKPNEGVASETVEKNYEANTMNAFEYVVHTIEGVPDLIAQADGGAAARGLDHGPRAMEILF